MKRKTYHGDLDINEVASALSSYFNRGPLTTRLQGDGERAFVQILTPDHRNAGGRTALGIMLRQVDDRLEVEIGKQAVLGLAASLGASALLTWLNPLNLLGRLDDIAQDIEHLSLDEQAWAVIDQLAQSKGASQQLSERLRRLTCEYCRVANPVGEGRCVACGAPLGDVQPFTCHQCGYVILGDEKQCPNCGTKLALGV
jgi:hypothetical protein